MSPIVQQLVDKLDRKGDLDFLRSREVEQEVLDLLDEPAASGRQMPRS
jgi:hypothetical protein